VAGSARATAELAQLGVSLDSCLVDRGETAGSQLAAALHRKHYDVIVIGAGVRLEPSLTPLLETLINVARTQSPLSALCFNTGPDSTVAAVQRAS